MILATSRHNRAFDEYIRLLLKLHRLIADGQGDGDDADAIRDEMDKSWRKLNSQETNLIRGLSSDLYDTGVVGNISRPVPAEIADAVVSATQQENYVGALNILRENAQQLPADYLSHWRGVCWADMEQLDVAKVFFQDAVYVNPNNDFHKYLLLRLMVRAEHVDDMIPLAEATIKGQSNPLNLYVAAMILFRWALVQQLPQRAAIFKTVTQAIEAANRIIGFAIPAAFRLDAVTANVWRSMSYDQLDQPDDAIRACEYALQLDPNNRTALQLRAMLTRGSDLQSSRNDALIGFGPPIDQLGERFASYPSNLPLVTP